MCFSMGFEANYVIYTGYPSWDPATVGPNETRTLFDIDEENGDSMRLCQKWDPVEKVGPCRKCGTILKS